MTTQTWLNLLFGSAGVASVLISLYLLPQRKKRAEVDIELTKEQRKEVAEKALALNDDRERAREKFWNDKVVQMEDRFNARFKSQDEELEVLETYVDRMVPWTWGIIRETRLKGIEYPDPPSLADVRRELKGVRINNGTG
jgi:hypothetical protein